MNRQSVPTPLLRLIRDTTGWPYLAAFQRRDSDLYLCVLDDMTTAHWVHVDTYEVWNQAGIPLPDPPAKTNRAVLQ